MKKILKLSLCLALALFSILLVSCKHTKQKAICPDGSHVFEEWTVIKEASCGEKGKRSSCCTVCGISTEEDIPATGMHTVVLELENAEDGSSAPQIVKKCSCCDEVLEVQLLSAQSGDPNVLKSNNTVDIDLSSYDVIYPQVTALRLSASSAKSLSRAVGELSGNILDAKADLSMELDHATKEILVGNTNRAESEATKTLLTQKGFAIAVIDNKIVIVGSDEIQTIFAINYFSENYISDSAQISVPKSIIVKSEVQNVTLSSDYTVVFSEDLDNEAGNTIESNSEPSARDYPCVAADELASYLGISNKTTDNNVADLEVLIGKVDRDIYSEFVSTLEGNEYGILVKDGKVIIASHSFLGLEVCVSQFKELAAFTKEGSEWTLPEGFYVKGITNDDWINVFPRPEGANISLYNTMDANDDSLQYLYTGSGVTSSAFDSYCQQLVNVGYTTVTENTIENSKFKTFKNEAKGITLHVSYNDFAYEAEYALATPDVYSIDYEKCIRIISAPLDAVTLPDEGLLTQNPTYNKVADSTITTVGLSGDAIGMSYVIRLEDGSFIIYDGGNNCPTDPNGQYDGTNGYTSNDEVAQLWNALSALHQGATGAAPSESNPIHIAAWVITHSHGDHFGVCRDFLATYGKSTSLKMDYMIGNFPASNALRTARGDNATDADDMGLPNAIYDMQQSVTGGFKYIKTHSGHKYYIANATIEVLMTYEDHNPATIQGENDVCTITRLSIASTSVASGSTSAASAAKTMNAMFLGDAQRYQSRYLCAMYGDYMQSEIVQLAHHGNIGCEIPLYETIAPTVVLWPHTPKQYSEWGKNNSQDFHVQVDTYVCQTLASVKYIYMADPEYATTLKLTASGPDYDNIYNVWDGNKKLSYGTLSGSAVLYPHAYKK